MIHTRRIITLGQRYHSYCTHCEWNISTANLNSHHTAWKQHLNDLEGHDF